MDAEQKNAAPDAVLGQSTVEHERAGGHPGRECPGGNPTCPGHDGDPCHYEAAADTPAWPSDHPCPRYRLIGRARGLCVQREVYEADLDMWTAAGVAGPFESRDAARQHMIETTDERTVRDAKPD